jgi:hypothetical protein
VLAIAVTWYACSSSEEGTDKIRRTLVYDFEDGLEGWNVAFADYPVGEEEFYELESGHAPLPDPLDDTEYALRISGNNHSDDLFMYAYRQVGGLTPDAEYQVVFDLEIASNAPEESVGVGGSPGASVYIKAGALTGEPGRIVDDLNWYRTDFDKGNQAAEGDDMVNIGTAGTTLDAFVYTIIDRSNDGEPFMARSNTNGQLWLIIGSDSGFESTTTLYYDKISVHLR